MQYFIYFCKTYSIQHKVYFHSTVSFLHLFTCYWLSNFASVFAGRTINENPRVRFRDGCRLYTVWSIDYTAPCGIRTKQIGKIHPTLTYIANSISHHENNNINQNEIVRFFNVNSPCSKHITEYNELLICDICG